MSQPADFNAGNVPGEVSVGLATHCVLVDDDVYLPTEHGSERSRQAHIELIDELTAEVSVHLESSPSWHWAATERIYQPRGFLQWLKQKPRAFTEINLLKLATLADGSSLELSNFGTLLVRAPFGEASALSKWKFARSGYLATVWDYAHRYNTTPVDAAEYFDNVIDALSTYMGEDE